MPCPLVELSRGPRHCNRDCASDEIRRARQDKRYRLVEAQGLDDCREEVLEAVRCEMHMGHPRKEPDHRVLDCLLQAFSGGGLALVLDNIELHAADGKITLLLCKPLGIVGEIGQEEETNDGDDEGDGALENEEPAPACDAANVVKAMVDSCGDESCESSREDVASIQNGNACCEFFACVDWDRSQYLFPFGQKYTRFFSVARGMVNQNQGDQLTN